MPHYGGAAETGIHTEHARQWQHCGGVDGQSGGGDGQHAWQRRRAIGHMHLMHTPSVDHEGGVYRTEQYFA